MKAEKLFEVQALKWNQTLNYHAVKNPFEFVIISYTFHMTHHNAIYC